MKKFFVFFAAALMTLSFASCGDGGNKPKDEAFKIDITNIATKGAHIAVTPADSTVLYYWDILEATEAAKLTDDAQVATYFKEYFDYVISYYADYGYEVTYDDLLLKGFDEYDYTGLTPNTEYMVISIALNNNIEAAGVAVRKTFKTLEEKEDPVPADMTFQIAVDDVTFQSAYVAVTPSNNTATYYWNIFETAEIQGMSDADLCAAIKENIEYTIEYYAYFGYDVSFADFLSQGADAYEYSELDSQTAYTVVAFAMGTLGTYNGAVAKFNFQTTELVPESEVTLDFHDATIKDYRDLDGSFMIAAFPEDSTVAVYLTPFSETFAGTFTKADLDLDYSAFIDYNEQKQYNIADAEFTGVETADGATFTGWFIATNAVKYNFSFDAVLLSDEPAAAPAKKAQVKKEAKMPKKGNLKKNNGKFISEKAFKF